MQTTDRQDLIVYGSLAFSFLALIVFKGGDFLKSVNEQSLITSNARNELRDSRIAERRFGNGCNTGIMMADGSPTIAEGGVVVDIRTRSPLSRGAVICDETGSTAVVSESSTATDVRVSARVRKIYIERNFRTENEHAKGGK